MRIEMLLDGGDCEVIIEGSHIGTFHLDSPMEPDIIFKPSRVYNALSIMDIRMENVGEGVFIIDVTDAFVHTLEHAIDGLLVYAD